MDNLNFILNIFAFIGGEIFFRPKMMDVPPVRATPAHFFKFCTASSELSINPKKNRVEVKFHEDDTITASTCFNELYLPYEIVGNLEEACIYALAFGDIFTHG